MASRGMCGFATAASARVALPGSRAFAGCSVSRRAAPSAARPRARAVAPRAGLNEELVSGGVPAGAAAGIESLPLETVPHVGPLPDAWALPGVYGVYDAEEVLQYVAAVADVRDAVAVHRQVIDDPSRVAAVRVITLGGEEAQEEVLKKLAYNWVVAHAQEGPGAPVGNTKEGEEWRVEEEVVSGGAVYFRKDAREEDANEEIRRILRTHRVVLFMKGSRDAPQCGFSAAMVELLTAKIGGEYETVDCLDEMRNRGLRDGIKKYADWPTIPQLYVNGDFLGGLDIVMELDESGELAAEFEKAEIPVLA